MATWKITAEGRRRGGRGTISLPSEPQDGRPSICYARTHPQGRRGHTYSASAHPEQIGTLQQLLYQILRMLLPSSRAEMHWESPAWSTSCCVAERGAPKVIPEGDAPRVSRTPDLSLHYFARIRFLSTLSSPPRTEMHWESPAWSTSCCVAKRGAPDVIPSRDACRVTLMANLSPCYFARSNFLSTLSSPFRTEMHWEAPAWSTPC